MPPVSEKQRRAMWAAKEGRSTLGIPKKVGEEFVGKDSGTAGMAAGVLHVAPDGDVLLLLRAPDEENYGGHWALPGGKGEEGETPEQTAIRESEEEIGSDFGSAGKIKRFDRRDTPNGMVFHTFTRPVQRKFQPTLNHEHVGYGWFKVDKLPRPLHPGVRQSVSQRLDIGLAEDLAPEQWAELRENFAEWTQEEEREAEHVYDAVTCDAVLAYDRAFMAGTGLRRAGLAFDRAHASVRTIDVDGRLHVSLTNISKATVNPYLGHEIPGFEKFGLDPDKIYMLLRDPGELAKGAATFNNIPLLSEHVAVSADDHKPDSVVGSTGTDAVFEAPYLRNSLVIWAKSGIDAVQSKKKKELSCAYRYRADMTPGVYEGARYDGVMRDIVGNHVALVEEGRAGSDVVVGDSKPSIPQPENISMSKLKLSPRASVARGALMVFLKPRLAQDAQINLSPLVAGITAKTFPKAKILSGVKKAVDGKLAQDASIEGLREILDMLEAHGGEDEEIEPAKENAQSTDPQEPYPAEDEDPEEEDVEGAEDEEETEAEAEAEKKNLSKDRQAKDTDRPVSTAAKKLEEKKAMDRKIKLAADAAVKAERDRQAKVSEAREKVRPWVGALSTSMAFDGAAAVYRAALETLGKNVDGVHDDALVHILEAQPKAGAAENQRSTLAMDSAAASSFAQRYPGAAKIRLA